MVSEHIFYWLRTNAQGKCKQAKEDQNARENTSDPFILPKYCMFEKYLGCCKPEKISHNV